MSEVREELRHKPQNGVTGDIWRLRRENGLMAVCKVLAPPSARAVPAHWQASKDPRHWNHWRRGALAYASRLVDPWHEPMLDVPVRTATGPGPADRARSPPRLYAV